MSDIVDIETTDKIDRYPGIRPFKREEDILFFGRRTEVEELIHSVKVHNVFVIFSKSGLGKSSLINAGLIPRLLEEGMYPLDIRFQNAEIDPREQIINEIKKYPSATVKQKDFKSFYNKLFYHLDALTSKKIVLIFDQFEEFFFHNPEHRITIAKALSDLVGKTRFSAEEIKGIGFNSEMQNSLDIKLIFAIRSDRISNLDEFTPYIPTILQNRYQLMPLSIDKAEKAIVLPAQLNRKGKAVFKTPPYFYDDNAIQILLEVLGKEQQEVESSQLQIVCQELERIAGNLVEREGKDTLTEEDFGGKKGIIEIQNKFYQNQLNILRNDVELNFDDEDILIIRRLIENELLSGNKRVSQSEGKVFEYLDKIKTEMADTKGRSKTQFIVEKLLRSRLIRNEETHLGMVYEISHDTLVDSILKAKTERRSQEQIDELNAEKARQEQQLKDERQRYEDILILKNAADKQKKRAGIWLIVSSIALFLSVVSVFIILSNQKALNEQKDKFKNVINKVLLTEADKNYSNGNDALAFRLFKLSDSLTGREKMDSIMKNGFFAEFSGTDIQTDDSLNVVCCKYTNNTLQVSLFDKKISKRADLFQVSNVLDYYFSANGKTLIYSDVWEKTYHVVRFSGSGEGPSVQINDSFSISVPDSLIVQDQYKVGKKISADGSCLLLELQNDSILLISAFNKKPLFIATPKNVKRKYYDLMVDTATKQAIISMYYSGTNKLNTEGSLWIINVQNFELSHYEGYYNFIESYLNEHRYLIDKAGTIYAVKGGKKIDSVLHIIVKTKLPDVMVIGEYLSIDYFSTIPKSNKDTKSYFLIYDLKNRKYLIDPKSGTTHFLSTYTRYIQAKNSTENFFPLRDLSSDSNAKSIEVFLPKEKQYKMVGTEKNSVGEYVNFASNNKLLKASIEDAFIKFPSFGIQKKDSLRIPGFDNMKRKYNPSSYIFSPFLVKYWDNYFLISTTSTQKVIIKIDLEKETNLYSYWNSFYPDIDINTKKSLGIDLLK